MQEAARRRGRRSGATPFDAVFDSPEAAELGEVDRSRAIALLTGAGAGPAEHIARFRHSDRARAAVDGFLHVQRAHSRAGVASAEPAGD